MAGLRVIPVQSAREENLFLEFPYSHYKDLANWVPPLRIAQRDLLDTAKHPFYQHAQLQRFLALSGGKVAGRVATILDRDQFEAGQGFFGFFECIDSQPVATSLLDGAREWLIRCGVKRIRGPVSPSTNYECGVLVDGFDSRPYVMMPYNPPFYSGLIEGAGFRQAKDLIAYGGPVAAVDGDKARRIASRVLKSGSISIRPIRMKEFDSEADTIWNIYNSAWSRNWGFAPMTQQEFKFLARDMKAIVDPGFALIGEVSGRAVGFALALPDINRALVHARGRLFPLGLLRILYYQRQIRSVRVLALGVLEEFRTAGIAAAFYSALIDHARSRRYEECEFSWVLEDNILMNRSIEALGVRKYKTYRIYEWTE